MARNIPVPSSLPLGNTIPSGYGELTMITAPIPKGIGVSSYIVYNIIDL